MFSSEARSIDRIMSPERRGNYRDDEENQEEGQEVSFGNRRRHQDCSLPLGRGAGVEIRNGFVRKVYGIVFAQLALTSAISAAPMCKRL